MESKKINQLATELTPALSDLTIIGDPTTGISKKITLSQMASLFTGTVEEYASVSAFPLVGVADTIYIALDTNVLYRWDTGLTSYVELSPNIINSLVFNDANGFDGTISLVGSTATLTITTALTTGSVGFIGASGALLQDNANFFWDDTNNRLGIGTNAPTTAIDVFGSGIIGRLNGTSTNNSFLGFASAGTNKWSIGNVQSDHRFRIYSEANTAELVSVLQTGEFGIGIANPTTKFHIDGGASALIANLDANVSVAKSISFRSDNSARINLEVSGTESGSNVGANFFLRTYTDLGALIETPFQITRSTGLATFKNIAITGLTTGSVLFSNGTSITQDNANFFWDDTNNRLGIGTNAPNAGLEIVTDSGSANALRLVSNRAQNLGTDVAISFRYLYDSTNFTTGGLIIIAKDNTTSGNQSGNIQFHTNNAGTITEKVRIGSAGLVTVTGSSQGYVGEGIYFKRTSSLEQGGFINGFAGGLNIISTDAQTSNYGVISFRRYNGTSSVESMRITPEGNYDYGGYLVQSSNNGTYRQSFYGGFAIMWRGAEDCYINSNHTYGSSNTNVASYNSSNGIGRLALVGGNLEWYTNTGSVTAGTAYTMGIRFNITKNGNIGMPTTYGFTTSNAANLYIDSGDGYLYRSTSSIKYKTNIEDLTINTTDLISKMRPIWYRSIGDADKKDWSWYGFIAEELALIEPRLVHFGYNKDSYEEVEIKDEEGNIKTELKLKKDAIKNEPDGVQYERITVLLVAELQKMRKELNELKAK